MPYEKRKQFIVNTLYAFLLLLIAYVIVKYALGLIAPFIFAFLIAYALKKPARFLSSKLRLPYKPLALALVLLFYCLIGLILTSLGVSIAAFITDFFRQLPALYATYLEPALRLLFTRMEATAYRMDPALISTLNELFTHFMQSMGSFSSTLSLKAVSTISNIASGLPQQFIRLLLMIISSFFIIGDYELITSFIVRQFPKKVLDLLLHIKKYVIGTLFIYIRSYTLIISMTFCELALGLTLVGVKNAIPVALCIAIFDILPVLGTGGIMIPWAVITAIQGDLPHAAGLIAVYLAITVVRNIVEPKIVGSQIGLHPVVTLMSLFVGAQLFGVIGLFGLPIMISLLVHLNKTGAIKLFK